MLNSEKFIIAMTDIDEKYLEEGRASLGYCERPAAHVKIKKTRRGLLIAAIIAGLLAATGCAYRWLGLSARLSPAPEPLTKEETKGGYISMNGYGATPEGKAHAEWAQFCLDYREEDLNSNDPELDFLQGGAELESYYRVYSAYDREMMDKLLEIREKYGVRLHTELVVPPNNSYFFKMTGLEPFILTDEAECDFMAEYLYEDGSFKAVGSFERGGRQLNFTFIRGAKGALDPALNYIYSPDTYDEWQYITSGGAALNIAVCNYDDLGERRTNYIFYQDDNYLVTIFSATPGGENYRANAEEFAEKFDYAAACGGVTDLALVTAAEPRPAKPRGELMTIKDWTETDEFKASTRFQQFYTAYAGKLEENRGTIENYPYFYYYGDFPTEIDSVNAEFEAIAEEYGLMMPRRSTVVLAGQLIPSRVVRSDRGIPISENFERVEVSARERYAMMGCEPFAAEGEPFFVVKYDNGAFFCEIPFAHTSVYIHYVPKGSFYPLFPPLLSTDDLSWAYDTACGEQVFIANGGEMQYPACGESCIIYETDTAYVIAILDGGKAEAYLLEMAADNIDFTKFK